MEETFGPVVGIMKVEGDEEALQLMNDSPYGLVSHPSVTVNHQVSKRADRILDGINLDIPR